MTYEELTKQVSEIVSQQVGSDIAAIKMETSFTELSYDSLDLIETVMDFEDDFNIEVKDEEVEKLQTIREAVNYIAEKLKIPIPT